MTPMTHAAGAALAAHRRPRAGGEAGEPPRPGEDGDDPGRRRPRIQPGAPFSPAGQGVPEHRVRQRDTQRAWCCPTCGHEPGQARARWHQRQDLAIVWLYADPTRPGAVIERYHCVKCQPHHHFQLISCSRCADGPIIAGDLADAMPDEHTPPTPVRHWLHEHGWHHDPHDPHDLVCGHHPITTSHPTY